MVVPDPGRSYAAWMLASPSVAAVRDSDWQFRAPDGWMETAPPIPSLEALQMLQKDDIHGLLAEVAYCLYDTGALDEEYLKRIECFVGGRKWRMSRLKHLQIWLLAMVRCIFLFSHPVSFLMFNISL